MGENWKSVVLIRTFDSNITAAPQHIVEPDWKIC